jgi:hypothetical protein
MLSGIVSRGVRGSQNSETIRTNQASKSPTRTYLIFRSEVREIMVRALSFPHETHQGKNPPLRPMTAVGRMLTRSREGEYGEPGHIASAQLYGEPDQAVSSVSRLTQQKRRRRIDEGSGSAEAPTPAHRRGATAEPQSQFRRKFILDSPK